VSKRDTRDLEEIMYLEKAIKRLKCP